MVSVNACFGAVGPSCSARLLPSLTQRAPLLISGSGRLCLRLNTDSTYMLVVRQYYETEKEGLKLLKQAGLDVSNFQVDHIYPGSQRGAGLGVFPNQCVRARASSVCPRKPMHSYHDLCSQESTTWRGCWYGCCMLATQRYCASLLPDMFCDDYSLRRQCLGGYK